MGRMEFHMFMHIDRAKHIEVNTDVRYFADIFRCIFVRYSDEISMKYVLRGLIKNKPALNQIIAWRHLTTGHYLDQ